MQSTVRYLVSCLALLLNVLPVEAGNTKYVVTLFPEQAMAAAATRTTTRDVSIPNVFGVSWTIVTTNPSGPSCSLALRYANDPTKTYVFATSVKGTAYTTTMSLTTTDGVSDLVIGPASSLQSTVSNDDTLPATVTIQLFVK